MKSRGRIFFPYFLVLPREISCGGTDFLRKNRQDPGGKAIIHSCG